MTRTRTPALVALSVLTAAASFAAADSVAFSESEFAPGSWSTLTPFWGLQPQVGETMSAITDRFVAGNPANAFMLTQYTIDMPSGGFNTIIAPVMLDAFVYDPSTDGAITSIAGSMQTLNSMPANADAYVTPRVYILQGGRLYSSSGVNGNWHGYVGSDADEVRTFSGYVESNFNEYPANGPIDLNSHPDFAGSAMQFGFGVTLTSTDLANLGEISRAVAFDNVNLRIQAVPSPASLALLGLGALVTGRRRRG